MTSGPEGQLELFELGAHAASAPRRSSLGRVFLHARYDQLVLVGIAGIIGLTILFAVGVERGKLLARTERALNARTASLPAASTALTPANAPAKAPVVTAVKAPASAPAVKATAAAPSVKASAPAAPKPAPATKPTRSKFAIQVVTFSRMQLARQELQRLQSRGEAAFLVTRGEMTTVYVGPFVTRTDATSRLGRLKSTYQDCFLKSL